MDLWKQSHRLDGMTFEDTNMLDFDGTHIKGFKNGRPAKIYTIEDLTGFIQTIYQYLIDKNIDLILGGDLINQEIISTFVMRDFDIPFIGLFGACSTFGLATIIGSVFIESSAAKRVIALASSHTQTAERTFRYPIEYGGAKEDSTTLTVTGCGAMLLSNKKSKIKVAGATIGKVFDFDYKNSFDLGGAMAPSAIETLLTHFDDFKRKPSDYDLILTGDLSQIGFSVVSTALNDKFENVMKEHPEYETEFRRE